MKDCKSISLGGLCLGLQNSMIKASLERVGFDGLCFPQSEVAKTFPRASDESDEYGCWSQPLLGTAEMTELQALFNISGSINASWRVFRSRI